MEHDVAFEDYREEWLEDVRAGNPHTTELGHRFARKLLTQWLEIDEDSDDLVYCDGAGDGGIDIAYLQRADTNQTDASAGGENPLEGDTWYLVQSKYGKAFQGIGTLIEEGQKVIDTLDGQRTNLSSLATGLLERLTNFRRQASERDRIVLVFATTEPLNEAQLRALTDVRAMGRERLKEGVAFEVEPVSVETIYQRNLSVDELERVKVTIEGDLSGSDGELLVGSIPLFKLYEFMKRYRTVTQDLDQLYEKNVRRFLGGRGRVNKGMQQTLQENPERFGLYNNGITLVVSDFSPAGEGAFELTDPYIVNGCQTSRTIWEVLYRKLETGGTGSDPKMDAWREKAEHGGVVAKIVKVGVNGEVLLEDITRYTNSQNAVREKDFLALTSDFQKWAKQMAERFGIYLEIQRGGWDSRKALQRQKPGIKQFTEYANAFDLLKVYGAGWLKEAGTAFRTNIAFAPNGSIFKRIINNEESDDPFGVEDLYAAFLLEKDADRYKFGRGGETTRRQTRFLFYLIVMDLLEDVLVRAQLPSSPKHLTRALLALFKPGNESASGALLDAAVEVVDEYLTSGTDNAVFTEPAFQNSFNNDLNAFLKWEQLGKNDQTSPRLRALLAMHKSIMSKSIAGQPSQRSLITTVIKA
jgi:hypothetical protein